MTPIPARLPRVAIGGGFSAITGPTPSFHWIAPVKTNASEPPMDYHGTNNPDIAQCMAHNQGDNAPKMWKSNELTVSF